MSELPKPETDDQPTINAINDNGYQVPCVDIEFARKLERERDEARDAIRALAEHGESEIQRITKERDEARDIGERLSKQGLDMMDENRSLKRERDEAREAVRLASIEAKALATSIQKSEYSDVKFELCDSVAGVISQIDNMYAGVREQRDEARKERDIARLEFEEISNDLKDARNRIWQLEKQIEGLNNFANERYEEIQKVHKERDEAREQCNIYHDHFLIAQREIFEMKETILTTLEENRHLADGDDCTLAKLKSVVPDWE